MKCNRCGRDFAAGLDRCPHCGMDIHYGGNTEFYGKAMQNKLTVKDLFSGVLKKHPKGVGAKMFMAGTPLSTPAPEEMLSEWQKPWLFFRVLVIGLIYGILLFVQMNMGYWVGIGSFLSMGCLIVPISILIFFWEVNIPRDIPLYTVILITLIGGVLSLIITMVVAPHVPGGAETAAFTEEPAKLIAAAIFIYLLDTKYIFGGMLIGASVGTGFAFMETIGYVMSSFMETGSVDSGVLTLILRSVLAIGGHVTWAAIEGGALVAVKKSEKLNVKHFIDPQFLIFLGASMAMHFTWNGGLTVLLGIPSSLYINVAMCVAAVLVVFLLLKKAVAQVLNVVDAAQFQRSAQSGGEPMGSTQPMDASQLMGPTRPGEGFVAASAPAQAVLTALSGPLAGSAFPFSGSVTIGRDPGVCGVVLPMDSPGISRKHCTLERRPDGFYLMDHGTTYGTFFQSGQRLPPNQWVPVTMPFYLGGQAVGFSCQ